MVNRTSAEQARVDAEIMAVESGFAEHFAGMDTYAFVEEGIAIFRVVAEGLPSVNKGADLALQGLLNVLVTGEAPYSSLVFGGKAAAAWRMYTAELVKRTAVHSGKEFREVPVE
ncbi:MAG: hypothetical protein JWS12_819 [Candidatus Saccharibacteria bacterium]|nr:hypothetical protein [Candidatus Saccharibacteria bacterium]